MYSFKPDFYADIRTEDRFTTAISYLNGTLQESKTRTEVRTFLRVFDGKMWYYSSTTDTDRVQEKLDELYAVATPNPAIAEHPVVRRFEVNHDRLFQFENCSVRDVPMSKKNELLQTFLPVLAISPCMTMPSGTYVDRNSRFAFCSSLGADIAYDYQTCGIVMGCDMVEGERKFSAHWQMAKTVFGELGNTIDQLRESMFEQLRFMRESVPAEPGDYPVILSPEAAGVFAHESFGHKSEADFMLSDETMKEEWQIGKTVGSPILTISECGSLPGSGYTPYDDEGTKARKNDLIRNGKLVGRLHSVTTAAALDEEVTGNARAVNGTFEPIVRMTNTYIEKGDLSFIDLIKPIKRGYFVKTIKHGSGMSTFTIAPSVSYEIVDGCLSRPVQISVITGNVFETLGLIDGLTDDVQMLSFVSGGCGKMEQYPLPVGFGGPCVRVSRMRVQ